MSCDSSMRTTRPESIYLVFEYDQTTGQWTTLTAHESYNGSADYEHRFSGIPRDEHRRRN